MRNGYMKISKRMFYDMGAFSNSHLFRRMRSGSWQYFWMAR